MAKPRPMGYIFPKRIKRAVAGDWSVKTFYGGGLTDEEKEKFKLEKEEELKLKEEKLKILQETKSPWTCPVCGKIMRNRFDQKYYNRRGMCMSCSIKGETYLRAKGLYKKYEESIVLRNYKAFLLDVKEQALDFLSNLKDEIKIVNHDGSFDTIRGDTTKIREFILKEIEDIDKKLSEVEDIDLSISVEESLGINLKEIVKNILIEEKKREQSTKENF